MPELTLSLKTANGEVVFTGCSHTGVEKITEQVMQETKNNIYLLYGGFHLITFGRKEIEKTAFYLKENLDIRKIALAHCTGHIAFKVLSHLYRDNYLYAGLGSTISF